MSKITNNIKDFANEVDLTIPTDLTETGFVKETPIKSNDINVYIKLGVNFIKGFLSLADDYVSNDYVINEYTSYKEWLTLIDDTFKGFYYQNVKTEYEKLFKQLVPNGTAFYGNISTQDLNFTSYNQLQGRPSIAISNFGKTSGKDYFTLTTSQLHQHSHTLNISATSSTAYNALNVGKDGTEGIKFRGSGNPNLAYGSQLATCYKIKDGYSDFKVGLVESEVISFSNSGWTISSQGGNNVDLQPYQLTMVAFELVDNSSLSKNAFDVYPTITLQENSNLHFFASERENIKQITISTDLQIVGFQPNTIISADEWTIYIYLINNFIKAFIDYISNFETTKLDEDFTSDNVGSVFTTFCQNINNDYLKQLYNVIHFKNSCYSTTSGGTTCPIATNFAYWQKVKPSTGDNYIFNFGNEYKFEGVGEFEITPDVLPEHTHKLSIASYKTLKAYNQFESTGMSVSQWGYDDSGSKSFVTSYSIDYHLANAKYTYNVDVSIEGEIEKEVIDFEPLNTRINIWRRTI